MNFVHLHAVRFPICLVLSIGACSVSASGVIDYLSLEKKATNIACSAGLVCISLEAQQETLARQEAFTVDGLALPADALRDADQQRAMIAAGLYITSDMDTKQIPVDDTIGSNTLVAQVERAKTLPVTIFPAPVITGRSGPIIIKTE